VHSRFDAATLPVPATREPVRSGRVSALALSIVLRAALRLVAVFA